MRRDTQAALDVNVGVDQTWRDVCAVEIDFFFAVITPDARDTSIEDRDVAWFDFAGEDVDDSGVLEDEVGGSVAAGNG